MEITIILTVSRIDFLQRVISSIELQNVSARSTSILAVVDGSEELYLATRNLLNETKYVENLTVMFEGAGKTAPRYDILARRKRIAAIHNQARELLKHKSGWVFVVEDDTLIPKGALNKLASEVAHKRSVGQITGVELGRWGVPYVGAWSADDIYDPKVLTSLVSATDYGNAIENIDACGLYCTLIRADVYKQHTFFTDNGLGPDVNFGIWLRQLGYENFIDWSVHCTHLTIDNGVEKQIKATDESSVVKLVKLNKTKWLVKVLD